MERRFKQLHRERLIERCFSVVYLPAVEMYEIFSRDRFANDATDEDRDRSQYLLECDLLIIDDLGTELVNTFTTSQLFYVVNERLNRKKRHDQFPPICRSNEMRDEFTDRVMSRIISQYQIIRSTARISGYEKSWKPVMG